MHDPTDFNDSKEKRNAVNVEVGNRIHKTRTDKKISREELSKRAKITPQFLRKVENGEKGLSTTTIRDISRALSVTSDYLLFGAEDTNDKLLYVSQSFANMSDAEIKGAEELLNKFSSVLRYPDE